MTVSDILGPEQCRNGAGYGLPAVVGDAYLYEHNPIFRNVRDACLNLGYSFSDADSPLWRSYQVFPLAALQSFLNAKTIPYIGNAQALLDIADLSPRLPLPLPLLLNVLKRNFLMHEAAHAIAFSVLSRWQHSFLNELSEKTGKVLRALMSEAFANTVERVSSHFATSSRHALYYSLNAYIPYRSAEVINIHELVTRFGCKVIFVLGFYLYVLSNVFSRPLRDDELDTVSSAVVPDLIERHDSARLIGAALVANRFSVNPEFRHSTNVMYFALHSCDREYADLVDSPLLLNQAAMRMFRRTGELFYAIAETGAIANMEESIQPTTTAAAP